MAKGEWERNTGAMAKRTVRSNGGSLISSSNHPTGCAEDLTDDTSTSNCVKCRNVGIEGWSSCPDTSLSSIHIQRSGFNTGTSMGGRGCTRAHERNGTSLFLQCLLFCPWVFHVRDNTGSPTYEASGEEENHSGGKIGCETDMNSIFDSKGRISVSSEDSMGLIPISLLRVTIDSKKKNNIHQSVDWTWILRLKLGRGKIEKCLTLEGREHSSLRLCAFSTCFTSHSWFGDWTLTLTLT